MSPIFIGFVLSVVLGLAHSCADKNSECAGWAARLDECNRNHAYMLPNCPRSCHQCKCGDNHPLCPDWSKNGECKKNPVYMNVHCRLSCNLCDPDEVVVKIERVEVDRPVYIPVPAVPEATTEASAL